MKLVFQPSRNVSLTQTSPPTTHTHTLPVCEWFQWSLHLLPFSGMFLLAPLCTMVTRVTSFFLAGQEDGRKRRETVTPTNQGTVYFNSYQLMNEELALDDLWPSRPSKTRSLTASREVNWTWVQHYFKSLENTSPFHVNSRREQIWTLLTLVTPTQW